MKTRTDRVQISYDLVFATPFHCGTGIREALIDRTIVADNNGYLYVPATTFKGVLREHCERLARFYAESDTLADYIESPHDKRAALYDLSGTISMITRIFGSPIRPGTLYFDDARQTEKDLYDSDGKEGLRRYLSIQKDVYTQVRLDRPTRTAVEGALYTSEFGARGLTFHGSITGTLRCFPIDADDPAKPTYSLLLLLAGLRFIERIGGNKSSGKGQCECKIKTVKINDDKAGGSWQPWFADLSLLSNYAATALEEEMA